MIRRVGLVANPDRKEAVRLADAAGEYLEKNGIRCVDPDGGRNDSAFSPEVIITFGGDGTLLIGAKYAMKHSVPLLGINAGTIGFLTEEEPERMLIALESMIHGEYRIEERLTLDIRTEKNGEQFHAINDAVITRGGFARLIRVECMINGERAGVYTADGIIAATPTGSTGYSLSAGGPIVEPGVNCMIITPVCAHSMQKCPFIVSENADIRFRLQKERNQTAEIQIDGMNRGTLQGGDEISITGSGTRIQLVRIHPYLFYNLVNSKLREWGNNHE